MKKFLIMSFALTSICCGIAIADTEFTPLNFANSTYTSGTSYNTVASVQNSTTNTVNAVLQGSTGSQNMQSAISQLDSAQVEVRNELLKYKSQYAEVDEKYNVIKAERAGLAKQVKSCEKRIKQLDKAKEKIRKNME